MNILTNQDWHYGLAPSLIDFLQRGGAQVFGMDSNLLSRYATVSENTHIFNGKVMTNDDLHRVDVTFLLPRVNTVELPKEIKQANPNCLVISEIRNLFFQDDLSCIDAVYCYNNDVLNYCKRVCIKNGTDISAVLQKPSILFNIPPNFSNVTESFFNIPKEPFVFLLDNLFMDRITSTSFIEDCPPSITAERYANVLRDVGIPVLHYKYPTDGILRREELRFIMSRCSVYLNLKHTEIYGMLPLEAVQLGKVIAQHRMCSKIIYRMVTVSKKTSSSYLVLLKKLLG